MYGGSPEIRGYTYIGVNCEQVRAGKETPVVCFESYSASNRN